MLFCLNTKRFDISQSHFEAARYCQHSIHTPLACCQHILLVPSWWPFFNISSSMFFFIIWKDAKNRHTVHYGRFRLIAQFNIELQICFHCLPPHILPTCSVVRAILVFEQWAGGGQNLSNYSNANKARQRTMVKNKTCWTRSRNEGLNEPIKFSSFDQALLKLKIRSFRK